MNVRDNLWVFNPIIFIANVSIFLKINFDEFFAHYCFSHPTLPFWFHFSFGWCISFNSSFIESPWDINILKVFMSEILCTPPQISSNNIAVIWLLYLLPFLGILLYVTIIFSSLILLQVKHYNIAALLVKTVFTF